MSLIHTGSVGGSGVLTTPGSKTPPTFDATKYGTPQFWLDAASITGLNDGDPVTTWQDKSPNAYHLTQATATNRPTYRTNVQNGLAAVRFTGASQHHFTDRTDVFARSVSGTNDPLTAFVVMKNLGPLANFPAVFGSGTNNTHRDVLYFRSTANEQINLSRGGGADRAGNLAPVTILSWIRAGVNAGGLWLNNVLLRDGAGYDPNIADGAYATQFFRSTTLTPNAGHFDGDALEIVIYRANLTRAQRAQAEADLAKKWGITL